jgi:hypothetical protein
MIGSVTFSEETWGKMFLENTYNKFKSNFQRDYTESALKLMIISWCIFIIITVMFVNNKALLAAILAYEVLP